jgi:hypothetical protein
MGGAPACTGSLELAAASGTVEAEMAVTIRAVRLSGTVYCHKEFSPCGSAAWKADNA